MKILLTYTYLDTCVECINNEFFEISNELENLNVLIDRLIKLKQEYSDLSFNYKFFKIEDFELESQEYYINHFRKYDLIKQIKNLESCEEDCKNRCEYLEDNLARYQNDIENDIKLEEENCELNKSKLKELIKMFELEFNTKE